MPASDHRIAALSRWRRFAPTVAAIVVIVTCVAAGNWQRERMHERQGVGDQLEAAAAAAPAPLPSGEVDWAQWRFRRVDVPGRFIAERQFLLDNRVHGGVVGFEVIAPLRTDDGRVVLVNRGFVAAGPSRAQLPAVPIGDDPVMVRARINLPPRFVSLGEERPQGKVWQHLDVALFARASGLAALPIVLESVAPTRPDDTLQRDWPRPDAGVDTNRSYMVQWYTFAALTAGLWAWFTFRRKR